MREKVSLTWLATLGLVGVIVAVSSAAQANLATSTPKKIEEPKQCPTCGFEIGNGRKLIRNIEGTYSMIISDKWEVGMTRSFTEVISSLSEGTPRARIQMNVVFALNVLSFVDLVGNKLSEGWAATTFSSIPALQRVKQLENNMKHLEIQALRGPGEIIVIRADGRDDGSLTSQYKRLLSALDTFKIRVQENN